MKRPPIIPASAWARVPKAHRAVVARAAAELPPQATGTHTGKFRVRRWCGGSGAGLFGSPGFEPMAGGGAGSDVVHALLPSWIGDGALIEVTVRVLRRGNLRVNPWEARDHAFRAARSDRERDAVRKGWETGK